MSVRIAAPKTATATVIFLHGFGDTGSGWSFLASECHKRPSLQHVNFVFPNAPERFYTMINDTSTGWFDLRTYGANISKSIQDEKGILNTVDLVRSYVDDETKKGISPKKIIVGGFSQGAAIAEIMSIICNRHILGGFLGLSGFLPMVETLKKKKSIVNKDTPVLLCHGTYDDIVPLEVGAESKTILEKDFDRTNIEFKTYKGLAHSASMEEIDDVLNFFEKILN